MKNKIYVTTLTLGQGLSSINYDFKRYDKERLFKINKKNKNNVFNINLKDEKMSTSLTILEQAELIENYNVNKIYVSLEKQKIDKNRMMRAMNEFEICSAHSLGFMLYFDFLFNIDKKIPFDSSMLNKDFTIEEELDIIFEEKMFRIQQFLKKPLI
jgi:hypothetical protein